MKSLRLGAPLVFLFLSRSACGGGDAPTGPGPAAPPNPDRDGDGILNSVDVCPDQPETFNGVFDADGCPDTTLEFYQAVRGLAEQFWDDVFTASALVYTPLGVFQEYTVPIVIPCGLTLLNNAVYCPIDLGVYYDINFVDSWLEGIGDAASGFIIVHEIGHHISFQRGWLNSGLISPKEEELQADCFAGVVFAFADTAGLLEEADLLEAARALIMAGDTNIPWFSPLGHGTAEQRLQAAIFGFDGGPAACTSADFFALFPEEGQELPGLE